MDATYRSGQLREHSQSLGHVPLINHKPRKEEKIEFNPAQAIRSRQGTRAERSNARLKDELGASPILVKGAVKVMSHLMFGVLALAADPPMRLRLMIVPAASPSLDRRVPARTGSSQPLPIMPTQHVNPPAYRPTHNEKSSPTTNNTSSLSDLSLHDALQGKSCVF